VDEAARLWCRRGLWYAGVDLAASTVSGAALTLTHRRSGGREVSAHIYLRTGGRLPSLISGLSSVVMLSGVARPGIFVSEACVSGGCGATVDMVRLIYSEIRTSNVNLS
jgi:transposase